MASLQAAICIRHVRDSLLQVMFTILKSSAVGSTCGWISQFHDSAVHYPSFRPSLHGRGLYKAHTFLLRERATNSSSVRLVHFQTCFMVAGACSHFQYTFPTVVLAFA